MIEEIFRGVKIKGRKLNKMKKIYLTKKLMNYHHWKNIETENSAEGTKNQKIRKENQILQTKQHL